ncbi:hypothetical protein [Wolbachia endosymbiont (group A) of Ennomos erosarius]|uniref:hypothetical protein n=1 Tax=Wolbachia endosymbiont (group A) of Ennomos erosarius TaxID=3066174 RepID=UPI003340601F
MNEQVIPFTVGAVASFGVGAGLIALGLESSIAITVLTAMVNAVIVILLSMVIERFSSPPRPGSSVDSGVEVDGADHVPTPTN